MSIVMRRLLFDGFVELCAVRQQLQLGYPQGGASSGVRRSNMESWTLQREQTCYGTMKRAASAYASSETIRNHSFLSIALATASASSE